MFGDGINSSICDSNCQGFTIQEDSDDYKNLVSRLTKIKESGSQIYSDQHDDVTWNPLDSSDNFREMSENGKSPDRPDREDLEVNPTTRIDVDTDPSSYGDNDVASIAQDIVSSNFIDK